MCTIIQLIGLCFWVSIFISRFGQNAGVTTQTVIKATVFVNGSSAIARIDSDFICATLDWWPPEKCDYGTCSWGHASLLSLDLNNTILSNAIKEFSPLKIRLGGTLQDKVIYDVGDPHQHCPSFVRNTSEMFGFTQGCLPMSRWDELNYFFREVKAKVIFGLNALNGRVPLPDKSMGGPWNSSNAAALIRYTVERGYTIHGWELGNELSGNGVGTRIGAAQFAGDVNSLQSIVQDIYMDLEVKPLVLAPAGFFDANWYGELIRRTLPDSLDVITHHIYNLGPGVDEHLIEKILNPKYLDGEAGTFRDLHNLLKSSTTSATAWVGEAGGAYNSGRNHVTNAFVFSFWYLDQLGMASTHDTKTYCRQSLIGGNYGLLNTTTFAPNPDYYSALLWHRLMGQNVLLANISGTNALRTYAHCAKESRGITLLLINLDGNTTYSVKVVPEAFFGVRRHSKHRHRTSRTKFTTYSVKVVPEAFFGVRRHSKHRHRTSRTKFKSISPEHKISEWAREEYHLTAQDGDLHSQTMLLNGKALDVTSDGVIPTLEPIKVNSSDPIIVAPFSILFVRIPYIDVPACR